MNHRQPHIVLAGGGTCGHLFPGVAVAEQLSVDLPGARITIVGSGKPEERQLVVTAGFDYAAVPCRPAPRKAWQAPAFLAGNLAGLVAARWFCREQHVSMVVGLGGYASVPIVRAGIHLNLPVVLLEQNAVPGRATAWLSRSASMVCGALPQVRSHLRYDVPLRITGNPVRRKFASLGRTDPSMRRPRLLVLGGSGGARTLNEFVPPALAHLGRALDDWEIVHQTGAGDVLATQQRYAEHDRAALVVSFIDNMADVLSETDLVIGRSGATSLAELAMTGTPAVVVPFPGAINDHQRENALVYASAGACRIVRERDSSGPFVDRLAATVAPLAADPELRRELSARMLEMARPNAAAEVSRVICEILYPTSLPLAA